MTDFASTVALVTGAADGIGRATADAFAHKGAAVVIADIDNVNGPLAAQAIRDRGGRALFVRADTTQADDTRAMVQSAVDEFGGLHIAVNNTGNTAGGDHAGLRIHEASEQQWDGTINVSLRSTFLSMKYELAHMVENGGGSIVNVSSIFALVVCAEFNTPAYAAAKAGVQHLTRLAAVNYAGDNIRVNAVAPGITATPGVIRDLPSEADRKELESLQPIARMVLPSEQAMAILWLASQDAAMVTGQVLPVDGGWSAQ